MAEAKGMCGIVGWASSNGIPKARFMGLRHALVALRHRGPDATGELWYGSEGFHTPNTDHPGLSQSPIQLALGHTRLSIIDLSSAGNQPMLSPDGRFCLTFNGEIYNYLELRDKLASKGHRFSSATDTEVLLHAYMEWGQACLEQLTGMFAFAVFDSKAQTVFLARDAFGIKPLFYTLRENDFFFASDLGAFCDLENFNPRLNPQKAFDYLMYGALDSDDNTLYENVHQLPPAGALTYDLKNNTVTQHQPFWKPNPRETCTLSFDAAADKLREMIFRSVELHMRSDVEVGAALSGGIDSSTIVSVMRHLYPDKQIHSFSYISESSSLSEEKWVDQLVSANNCIAHKTTLHPEQLVAEIEQLIRIQGEPFTSTSIYAQFGVFRLASAAGIKVTLDGQGADEIFGGYDNYQGYHLASLIAQRRYIAAGLFSRRSSQWPNRSAAQNIQRAIYSLSPQWLAAMGRSLIGEPERPGWIDDQWLKDNNIDIRAIVAREPVIGRQHLKGQQVNQITRFGLPNLLRYADRNSMSFSIESRLPFLTTELADFALSLPEHYLIDSSGCSKAILRKAMEGIVPKSILYRRDKIGFATSQADWLEQISSWVTNTLAAAEEVPFLNHERIQAIWNRQRKQGNLQPQVWRWVNFLHWMKIHNPKL